MKLKECVKSKTMTVTQKLQDAKGQPSEVNLYMHLVILTSSLSDDQLDKSVRQSEHCENVVFCMVPNVLPTSIVYKRIFANKSSGVLNMREVVTFHRV